MGIGFAPGTFHGLADQEPDHRFFPSSILGHLSGVLLDDRIDQGQQFPFIGQLPEPLFLDQLRRRFVAGVEFGKNLLGDFQTDGVIVHQLQQAHQPFRRHGGRFHGHPGLMQLTEKFTHEKIADEFGFRKQRDARLKIVG